MTPAPHDNTHDNTAVPLSGPQKGLLFAGALGCYAAWYALGQLVSLPAVPHFSGLLIDHRPAVALAAVAIAFPLLSTLVSFMTGSVRSEAALFCCAIGLVSLAARGGDIRTVLLQAESANVYLLMLIEIVFLGLIISATYELLNKLRAFGIGAPAGHTAAHRDSLRHSLRNSQRDSLADRLTAVAAQALCTLVLLIILGQSPVRGQALAGVCAAGLIASLVVHQSYRVRGGIWYMLGTLLAGAVGYIYAYFNPDGLIIGDVRGMFAGAARALPLHYASLGVAGSIFGYWWSLTWQGAAKAVAEPA